MNEIVQLIRENAMGTFVLLVLLIWAMERMVVAALNRNRPIVKCECDCSCCDEELDEDEE